MKNILHQINNEILNNPKKFVDECEAEYRSEVDKIAHFIAADDDIIIVAIAGPSSSGKTTTANLLRNRLEELDEVTAVVSLDDFYLSGDELPLLPDGQSDIESVNALDIELIKHCFNEIIFTGKTELPKFDFKKKVRSEEKTVLDIGRHGIVIVEGLHALNPLICDLVPKKNIYKIYISVNRPIEDENGRDIISSRQIRLVRRALRDEIFRNSSINDTLSLWNNVINGEKQYLYCFKPTADVRLTTLHPYELGLYKNRFLKMRESVKKDAPCYEYFIRTANALEHFESVSRDLVPEKSLLREFIG